VFLHTNQQLSHKPEVTRDFGKVPKYLQKFNLQREEQKLQKLEEEEAKKFPPGTRKMGEEERLRLLEDLKKTKG